MARDTAKVMATHPHLTVVTGDVLDPGCVAEVAEGRDIVISAVRGGGPAGAATIERAARSLVEGYARWAPTPRA